MRKLLCVLLLAACQREAPVPQTPAAPPVTATQAAEPAKPTCVPAPQRLCPVDEADSDPSFASYRGELMQALEANDDTRLRALISPKVRTSFGNGGGVGEVLKLREELQKAIRLGGAFREGMFWAPYVYAKWPESVDAFEHVAATRAEVAIHEMAHGKSSADAFVDWEILKIATPRKGPDEMFLHVRTADGKEGFVRSSDVRSPVGYRAGFGKENGAWKLQALVSGD